MPIDGHRGTGHEIGRIGKVGQQTQSRGAVKMAIEVAKVELKNVSDASGLAACIEAGQFSADEVVAVIVSFDQVAGAVAKSKMVDTSLTTTSRPGRRNTAGAMSKAKDQQARSSGDWYNRGGAGLIYIAADSGDFDSRRIEGRECFLQAIVTPVEDMIVGHGSDVDSSIVKTINV